MQAENARAVKVKAFLRVFGAFDLLADGVAQNHPRGGEEGESYQRRFLEALVVGCADFAAH